MSALKIHRWTSLQTDQRDALLTRPLQRTQGDLATKVAEITADVRRRGDQALIDYAQRFDSATIDSVVVGAAEIDAARATISDDAHAAITAAIANVRAFHTVTQPTEARVETQPGVVCERVVRPIDAVGLYVPAGTAPLPSAAIMLGVPARLANCPTIVMASPPRADGSMDPHVLAVAAELGVTRVVRSGGAQAIAAMAYGTASIPAVNKIFGPGNAFVTAAKQHVAADAAGAAIDMPAGPSEVMVLADDSADPAFVAADLLSQAEHGVDSQVILVTTTSALAIAVSEAIDDQLLGLSRRDIAAKALASSATIVVSERPDVIAIANAYAPEHLIIQMNEPRDILEQIRNAGSVFLGPWSPESVGDYCSGTNHVLPTYGYARSFSGLSSSDFCRQMTVQALTREGLENIGPTAITLAGIEGLDAHANAVRLRLGE
ncbi:MAG: histidinol dehydrogenase [Pseudomonadota bacterium]